MRCFECAIPRTAFLAPQFIAQRSSFVVAQPATTAR
jgi:hypothetical protein